VNEENLLRIIDLLVDTVVSQRQTIEELRTR
jgi:hypothetical protein